VFNNNISHKNKGEIIKKKENLVLGTNGIDKRLFVSYLSWKAL
jgi:hypothetical protein